MAWYRNEKWLFGLGVLILCTMALSVLVPSQVRAAALPGKITALPNPPGAPERDVFLITFAHPRAVPTSAVFHFSGKKHTHVTARESLRKLNTYQYEALWAAPTQGSVTVDVYAKDSQLLASAGFPVGKAKTNVLGRVVLGAIFIGASLWFWWRQQRFYRSRH